MDAPLFDHQLDDHPPMIGVNPGGVRAAPASGKARGKGETPATLGGWVEGLGVLELVGWSVSLGALVAMPLAAAARLGQGVFLLLAGCFMVTPFAALARTFLRPGEPRIPNAKGKAAPAKAAPVKVKAEAGPRVRIQDVPEVGLRIDVVGRPFVDEVMLAPFVVGLLVSFGVAGTVMVQGLRGEIPKFHAFYPFMVGPALFGTALLVGNVLQMFVNETLLIDGNAFFLAYDFFGFRGVRRWNLRHVAELSFDAAARRVVVPSAYFSWMNAYFGVRLKREEAARIVQTVSAYRRLPSRREPAGMVFRHLDPMRGLGPTSRRVRIVDEGRVWRVSLATRGSNLEALLVVVLGLAPMALAMGAEYALRGLGVPPGGPLDGRMLKMIGWGYVASFLGFMVLQPKLAVWVTARTDGEVLELTQGCGLGSGPRFRALTRFLSRPVISWGRGKAGRGERRRFWVGELSAIDSVRRISGSGEDTTESFDLEILEGDGSLFSLAEWMMPGSWVPKDVVLFAQHLRDILGVPGDDSEPGAARSRK